MIRPAVLAAGLTQRFGSRVAVQPLSLELRAGERLAVLGDNGAGKSTLLRMLATADRPAGGELSLFGVDALKQRALLRPRIGWLAHQSGLYPALTAAENLRFFCTLLAVPVSRSAAVLDLVGLSGSADRRDGDLSRGLQQRLAIARSLLHDPELWILDEPDASLDSDGRRLLTRLAEGRTLIVATHDLAFARGLCERSLRLREGRALGDEFGLQVLG